MVLRNHSWWDSGGSYEVPKTEPGLPHTRLSYLLYYHSVFYSDMGSHSVTTCRSKEPWAMALVPCMEESFLLWGMHTIPQDWIYRTQRDPVHAQAIHPFCEESISGYLYSLTFSIPGITLKAPISLGRELVPQYLWGFTPIQTFSLMTMGTSNLGDGILVRGNQAL